MFQCNTFNRHRSISNIIFWLYLVGKTRNKPLIIITATYHILKWSAAFKHGLTRINTVILPSIFIWRMWNANLWISGIKNLYENWKWLSPLSIAIFWCICLLIVLKQYPVDNLANFFHWLTEEFHTFYNVQSYDKHENELKGCGWDAYHLFTVQEY